MYRHPRLSPAHVAHELVMSLESALNERSPSEVRLWRRNSEDFVPVNGHLITAGRDLATTTALFESGLPVVSAPNSPGKGFVKYDTENLVQVVLYELLDLDIIGSVPTAYVNDAGRLTSLLTVGARFETCPVSDADAIDGVESVLLPAGFELHPKMEGRRIVRGVHVQTPEPGPRDDVVPTSLRDFLERSHA